MARTKGPGPAGRQEANPLEGPRLAYSIRDLEERTSLGRTTLYALMKDKTLVCTKVGTRTIVTPESWQACLATLAAKGGAK